MHISINPNLSTMSYLLKFQIPNFKFQIPKLSSNTCLPIPTNLFIYDRLEISVSETLLLGFFLIVDMMSIDLIMVMIAE